MMKNLRRFRACAVFVLALLVSSFVVQAQNIGAIKQAAKDAKVSTDLLSIIASGGVGQQAPADGANRASLFVTKGDFIAINAFAISDGQALLQALQALGLNEGMVSKQWVYGFLPVDKLSALKNIDELKFARPAYKPTHKVGAVTSQADDALRANVARTTYGVNGAGIKVGILSDSYNNLGGAAAGVASGDLPAGVQVLKDFAGGGTDEGRGMAELIYDVAPGTSLAFHTAFESAMDFAQGIRDLAAAGCKIITDDVGYGDEPFFQDGPIAQAVDDVVNNSGVTYFSSASNDARNSYQNTYASTPFIGPFGASDPYMGAHNFGGGDVYQSVTVPAKSAIYIVLQWDNPFYSVSGGAGAQTDMDLLVYKGGAFQSSLSGIDFNTGADPIEFALLNNTSNSAATFELVLAHYSGPAPSLIKWVALTNGYVITTEYDTKSSTIVGHANSSRCIAVGAAPFYNTPAFNGAATATIEYFSSAGGTPIYFNTTGMRLGTPAVRQKPEITSVDGTNTTFFGTDISQDADAFPNFFGTSASAPNAAAVAALMKQKVPSITPATIRSVLENTALDMDDPSTAGFDTGFDFGTGYGFIQADRALMAISPSSLSLVVSANPTTLLTTGTTTLSATVSGGTTPYSYTFSGPGTITPSGNTAMVSNLPAGVQTFTVRAKDATSPTSQTISGMVSVTVNMAPPGNTPPTVANPVPPQSATVGVAYTLSLANVFTDAETPASLTLSVSGLPAGLSFVPPATISGTPSMSGVSMVTVKATDPGSLTASNSFNITVSPAAGTPPTPGAFAITGATTVSCTTLSAGQRALTFNPQYAGLNGSPVSFSVANEMLPTTNPGPYTLNLYTDNPVITLKATQSGTPASFAYNWLVACSGGTPPPPPPTGTFSITGVTTVSCTTLSAGQRALTFNPKYAGLDGSPVSFSVANEMLPTINPGPYTLNLYTDNPVITLKATQSGTPASFAYNWVVACNGGTPGAPSARVGAGSELTARLRATILPNPVAQEFRIRIEGAQGQSVRLELSDLSGHSMVNRSVDVSSDDHQESLRFSQPGRGMYLLRVSTGQQAITLKVIRE